MTTPLAPPTKRGHFSDQVEDRADGNTFRWQAGPSSWLGTTPQYCAEHGETPPEHDPPDGVLLCRCFHERPSRRGTIGHHEALLNLTSRLSWRDEEIERREHCRAQEKPRREAGAKGENRRKETGVLVQVRQARPMDRPRC